MWKAGCITTNQPQVPSRYHLHEWWDAPFGNLFIFCASVRFGAHISELWVLCKDVLDGLWVRCCSVHPDLLGQLLGSIRWCLMLLHDACLVPKACDVLVHHAGEVGGKWVVQKLQGANGGDEDQRNSNRQLLGKAHAWGLGRYWHGHHLK